MMIWIFTRYFAGMWRIFFFREKEKLHELWLYNSPAEAVYDLKNGKHWDLYFLDIEMPEMDGFELAGKIRKEAPEAYLVFLTSHEELAAEGYNYKELSYIPKSLLEDNMDRTLQRFWTEYHSTYNKTYRIVTDTRLNNWNMMILSIYTGRKTIRFLC